MNLEQGNKFTSKQPKQIYDALAAMSEELKVLEEIAGNICDTLQPILSVCPSVGEEKRIEQVQLCGLANEIRLRSEGIRGVREKLCLTLNRIQL